MDLPAMPGAPSPEPRSGSMPLWLPWRAATTPHRLALIAPDGETLSYARLDAVATRMAHRLAAAGVQAGDRVAVLLPNGVEFAALTHAVMRLGAVLLPLNLRLTTPELAWQLEDAGARLLLSTARTAAAAAALGEKVPGLVTMTARVDDVDVPSSHSSTGATLLDGVASDDTLAIVYTSGTTGRPKGAMLTYGNFWWSAVGSALNLGVHDDDRWLVPLPLFHVGGLSVLTRSAIYGTAALLHGGFDAGRVNSALDHDRVTLVSLVPTMLGRVLDARGDRPFPPTLRCVLLGGGPASPALLARCAAGGLAVSQSYGLTEACSQVATLAPADAHRKLGSAGRPLHDTRLRIVRNDGSDAAAGEAGEIVIRGPTVTPGYWNRPDASAAALSDGWFRTGDVGRLDSEGFLYVLDRRDDLIVTGGENVYPAEVEGVLETHEAVAEAAVLAVTDPEWGERVQAVIRLRRREDGGVWDVDRLLNHELPLHCRSRLAGYKIPSAIVVSSAPLPRTASGKLMRGALREMVRAGRPGEPGNDG